MGYSIDQEELEKSKKIYFNILNRTWDDIERLLIFEEDNINLSNNSMEYVRNLLNNYFNDLKT